MARDDASKRPYAVGYGKPPKASQFKPGASGNPKGRPRGAKNFSTLLERELDRLASVTIDGEKRHLPKRIILVRQLVDRAVRGDHRAMATLLKLSGAHEAGDCGQGAAIGGAASDH